MKKVYLSDLTQKWVVVGVGSFDSQEEAIKAAVEKYGAAMDGGERRKGRKSVAEVKRVISLALEPTLIEQINEFALADGITVSALLRRIVTDYASKRLEAEQK